MGNVHRDAARAAAQPARALPAAPPPIPLDSLLARAGAIAQPRTLTATRSPAAPRHVSPHADETPSSILLPVTVSHCTCGNTVRSPAPYVLVRYAENAHTVHYRSTGLDAVRPALMNTLPHETRDTHVDVPYCEECF
jgi:hypothetical protein